MARGNQIARQWTAIKTLDGRPRGMTIAELSCDLNCSPRNVYRELDYIPWACFPIFDKLESRRRNTR